MKGQILFSGKNKKNILKCRPLKILPRVLSIKVILDKIIDLNKRWYQVNIFLISAWKHISWVFILRVLDRHL